MEHRTGYTEMFFLFFAGSILGFLLEGIWRVIRTGSWENHSATVYGPFCIVYGAGAAALYWISSRTDGMPVWKEFLIYAAVGALTEYLGSFLQEYVFGSVSWDYGGRFLNINGRICFSMTMMWGMLGLVFSRLCVPAVDRIFDMTADWPIKGLCVILSVLMGSDLLISAGALFRWRERQYDIPPKNVIGAELDEHYDDERMEEIYNNMVFVDTPHGQPAEGSGITAGR